ncbi:MAG: lysine--tRNA ligase [Candidatus Ancaeobacter aquaticus]|nr:lysine--tRNA ligase [Candidatus Ancaeobacter aquaticus]
MTDQTHPDVTDQREKDFISERKERLQTIVNAGGEPYGRKFERSGYISEYIESYEEGKLVTVCGRVMAWRGHGKTVFADVRDRTGKIQMYARKDELVESFDLLQCVDIGDIIGITGKLVKTRTGEVTVHLESFAMLSKALRPLPEKWHGLKDIETRYRQRYLDLISNEEVRNVFLKRSAIITLIRKYLDEREYLEVETPMMQAMAGGAVAKPFVTYHESLSTDLYLRIAPELYLKRLLVGGLEKVYELNRNFRNEGLSRRHNPEFTMLEIYAAYEDYESMMTLTEELTVYICSELGIDLKTGASGIDMTPPWKRISMYDALKEYTGIDFKTCDNIKEQAKKLGVEFDKNAHDHAVVNEIFESCVEKKLINPTFITDYPAILCPLSKTKKDDPEIAERFELYMNGQELANAYSELNDPAIQLKNFQKQAEGTGKDIDEDYVRALEHGMPPAGGLGIGIDRLVMVLTNQESIRDVILFPQLKGKG